MADTSDQGKDRDNNSKQDASDVNGILGTRERERVRCRKTKKRTRNGVSLQAQLGTKYDILKIQLIPFNRVFKSISTVRNISAVIRAVKYRPQRKLYAL